MLMLFERKPHLLKTVLYRRSIRDNVNTAIYDRNTLFSVLRTATLESVREVSSVEDYISSEKVLLSKNSPITQQLIYYTL